MIEKRKISPSINTLYVKIIEHKCQTVCFTSVDFKEGITTIATATARAAASYGRRVLYCDFGNYNTSLTKQLNIQFDAKNEHPLKAGSKNIQFIEPLGFDLLSLPGPRPLDISLIKKESLLEFFNELKTKYDCIFIDAHCYNKYQPFTLPTRMLCEVVDATILVIQSGGVTITEVKETTAEMVETGAKLLGLVMNDKDYPKLVDELCQKTIHINQYFPKLGEFIRKKLKSSVILNIET
jgi:Mrp family chromosome partitioning ATPase